MEGLRCVPASLQVRGGHNEAARYLLSKGADVTVVAENGDSALSVANSPRMKKMIRGKGEIEADTREGIY